MMRLRMLLNKISQKMRNSQKGKKVYHILQKAGICMALNRFFNWREALYNEKHPNKQMLQSREFFRNNAKRVKKVMRLLEDRESKDVFKKMIRFRCFSRYDQLPHNSMRNQYFVNDIFTYSSSEVFVDCGAYNGDTIAAFKKQIKKKVRGGGEYKIIAFEPDEKNYRDLMRNHPDIIGIQAGVWQEDGCLGFQQDGYCSSVLESVDSDIEIGNDKSSGEIQIPVRCIDHVCECKDATFIKMDIEGSEYHALLGADKVIRTNKPKLAICIYHSDEDMLRLVELIHGMVPEYHFYIRQHSNTICETVLYAVI